jgi:excisionase family DNA binding protein
MSNAQQTNPPSPRAALEADAALRALSPMARRRPKRTIRVRSDDDDEVAVTVPAEAFQLFLDILAQMANGNAVTVVPVHAELTTQEAANLLKVSRPYLVRLLDEGKIPHRLVGTHRRVLATDLFEYKRVDDAERKAVADELTAEAQKLGLGY